MKKFLTIIRNNLKRILFITIPLLFFIIVVVITYKVEKKNHEFVTEKGSFYQYFMGTRFDYDGVLTLNNASEVTDMKLNNYNLDSYSSPIYYRDSKKIILPVGMSLVTYSNGSSQNYVSYFSEISYINGNSVLTFGDKFKIINDKFLYDGDDLYLFLNDVQITYNDQILKIPAMSYVIVNYRESIEIYSYGEKNGIIVELNDTDVYAYGTNLVLNMSLDSFQENGEPILLYKKVNDLPKISGW